MNRQSDDNNRHRIDIKIPHSVHLPGEGEIVEVTALGGEQICLARLNDGRLVAFDALCPHGGAPLCKGVMEKGRVYCLKHLWSWEVETGVPEHADRQHLRVFRIKHMKDK